MFLSAHRARVRRTRRRCAPELMGLEERRLLSDMTAPVTTAAVSGATVVSGTAVPTYQAASGATVTINLTATDPDDASSALTTNYSTNGGATFTQGNTITLSADGSYDVKYDSVDPAGNTETMHTLVVNIGASAQPTLTVTASPNSLWPPNHKPVTVTVSGAITTTAAPGSAGAPTQIAYNVNDEYSPGASIITGTTAVATPTANTGGTYTYSYQFQVSLVASRLGQDKDGRTYTINVSAENSADTTLATNSTTVLVPHDQGQGGGGGGGGGNQDTIDRDFIDAAFLAVLHRPAGTEGEDFFAGRMAAGMSPAQVISILQHSPEYDMNVVTALYQKVLNRAPDSAGLAAYTGWLQAGATPQMVEQSLLDSPEFNADHPTNVGFLSAAYQVILGRPLDAGGQAFFTGLLNAGVSRNIVISDLLYSPESDQDIVTQAYVTVLNRAPDEGGDSFFVHGMERGTINSNALYFDLLVSSEFFTDATGTTQGLVAQNGGGEQGGGSDTGGGGNQGGHGHGNGHGNGHGHGHG